MPAEDGGCQGTGQYLKEGKRSQVTWEGKEEAGQSVAVGP